MFDRYDLDPGYFARPLHPRFPNVPKLIAYRPLHTASHQIQIGPTLNPYLYRASDQKDEEVTDEESIDNDLSDIDVGNLQEGRDFYIAQGKLVILRPPPLWDHQEEERKELEVSPQIDSKTLTPLQYYAELNAQLQGDIDGASYRPEPIFVSGTT